ncbi:MAG: U32 family peptidase [Bacteroidales bacterium]|nr:U32 family peptidase [Bacteroidales bacterium]
MKLELLSPAKNLEFGREAVNHGADALYIGAPAFGARAAATNTIEDIEELVRYAHLYGSKVFATVNTLLFDNELDDAVKMIHRLYDSGVDALIIQDLGLLECDLPPIELHASTQCHNATVERVKFMESVGFRRVILARETSLKQMHAIRQATTVDLEAFVHGALCVSYSGQCYMSQYLNGRSGNRGCCSQPCRSAYDLETADGQTLIRDRHLLSLKDFNASQQLENMIAAGITSFKIEGRLKDLNYVKNVTAYYRQQLDNLIEGWGDRMRRASSGKTMFFFTPDVERTFNRGYTDYFLRSRRPMANFATQKSLGKRVGEVVEVGRRTITVGGNERFSNGDGLCCFDADGRMQGFLVNAVQGRVLTPSQMPDIVVGTTLWRNQDIDFERQLKGRSADRRIGVRIDFGCTDSGFMLEMEDEDGVRVTEVIEAEHVRADDCQKCTQNIEKQLAKLGDTPFCAIDVNDSTGGMYFLPVSTLNQVRRVAVEKLTTARIDHFHTSDCYRDALPGFDSGATCGFTELDYRANVVNSRSADFYKHHGIKTIEHGLEQTGDYGGKALMTTKYCLRYELGCCLCDRAGQPSAKVKISPADTLVLHNNGKRFRLEFDCRDCLMRIYKSEK